MDFTTYVRKPFTIDAIEITKENIAELAPMIGTLETADDGSVSIAVNNKKVHYIDRVHPGFWLTKMGNQIRCYKPGVFSKQFVESNPDIAAWVAWMNDSDQTDAVEDVAVSPPLEPA